MSGSDKATPEGDRVSAAYYRAAADAGATVVDAIEKLIQALAAEGIKPGALVENTSPVLTWRGIYRVTDVEISLGGLGLRVWIYGNKQRRDGSWGTHKHGIGSPDDHLIIRR